MITSKKSYYFSNGDIIRSLRSSSWILIYFSI